MESMKETTGKKGGGGTIVKIGIWYLFILFAFAFYTNWLPQIRGDAPEAAEAVDVSAVTPEKLAEMGKKIIFGTDDPLGVLARGEGPIGKGQCPLCHQFFTEQKADRCPNLMAVPLKISGSVDILLEKAEEVRSHERPKMERYKQFAERLAGGEPNSGHKPHAQTGGQYLVESEYCPNCFVVEGFGLKGTNDTVSPMPIINKPPIQLTDTEIVSVVSFLQTKEGDMNKWTAKQSWEEWHGKKLDTKADEGKATQAAVAGPPIAMNADTPEQIVQKMGCFACHKIPGITIAKTGVIGPLLIEGTNAPNRIKSKEYLQAVKEGKARARTPKEYVMESIMTPGVFIVPGFADDMLKDFSHKFTFAALEHMADYLLQQTADKAIEQGLDRLPNEKEGPLKKADIKPPDQEKLASDKPKESEGREALVVSQASGGTF